MGTKANPGEYDCYAKLDEHEEHFVLRAKDPSMPHLVRAWASLRRGDPLSAVMHIVQAGMDSKVQELACSDERVEKFEEAAMVALRGEIWYQRNRECSPSSAQELWGYTLPEGMPTERVKIACDVAEEAYEAGLGWIEIVGALAHIFRLPASIHHPPSRLKAQAMQIAMSLGRQKFGA